MDAFCQDVVQAISLQECTAPLKATATFCNLLSDPVHATCGVQAALPCLLMARDQGESELILKGGTDAAMAPPVWYYQHVCLPLLRTWWGLEADLQVLTALDPCVSDQYGF